LNKLVLSQANAVKQRLRIVSKHNASMSHLYLVII